MRLATALGLLDRQGDQRIPGRPRARPPGAIVLLSDGKATSGQDPIPVARRAGRLKIPVYTVALGTPQGTIQVPRVERQRNPLAGGSAGSADDAEDLPGERRKGV